MRKRSKIVSATIIYTKTFFFSRKFSHFLRANEMRKQSEMVAKKKISRKMRNFRETIFPFRWKPYLRLWDVFTMHNCSASILEETIMMKNVTKFCSKLISCLFGLSLFCTHYTYYNNIYSFIQCYIIYLIAGG